MTYCIGAATCECVRECNVHASIACSSFYFVISFNRDHLNGQHVRSRPHHCVCVCVDTTNKKRSKLTNGAIISLRIKCM